ncbi:MAG: hypothetical protein WC107_06740 [Patescibacteria group bacterium]
MDNPDEKGQMPVTEAGLRGGLRTRDLYGPEYFREIGRLGGLASRKKHYWDYFEEVSQYGGYARIDYLTEGRALLGEGHTLREYLDRGKEALVAKGSTYSQCLNAGDKSIADRRDRRRRLKDGKARIEGRKKICLTVGQAGRKGGLIVRDRYCLEFYEEIGKKGGRACAEYLREGMKKLGCRPKYPREEYIAAGKAVVKNR